MASRYRITVHVLVSDRAAAALRGMAERDRPAAVARFLGAQSAEDLRRSIEVTRIVPWTEPDDDEAG